ncbi:MAG: hypothetical protein K6T73_01080, partial [Candidatus Bathyarchaeota archaeon]|nr:hypothetical protein [Candidatus Bathyarchaeota archaeon]
VMANFLGKEVKLMVFPNEQKKFRILSVEGCKPCERIKEKLGDRVDFVDLNSEQGKELIEKGIVDINRKGSVSLPLGIDENNQSCEIFFDDDVVLAVCGGETRVLYEREEDEEKERGDEKAVFKILP